MQYVILTLHNYSSLHNYFNFKIDKKYLYWPYTIIVAYTIILIPKTDNPTRLFHATQLFGTAE